MSTPGRSSVERFGPAALLTALYVPSLWFGFLWDDSREVQRTLASAWDKVLIHPRPLYYLSFVLTNDWFSGPFPHHLVNLLLLATAVAAMSTLAWRAAVPFGPVVVLAIFLHPSFVYPITNISQRNDLLLLSFLPLAMAYADAPRGFVYLVLSDLAKAPFVLHNLWYAVRRWSDDRVRAIAAVLIMVALLALILRFWAPVETGSTSPMSGLTGSGAATAVFKLIVTGVKSLEGIALAHAPFEAHWDLWGGTAAGAALVGYLGAWGVLVRNAWRRRDALKPAYKFFAVAVLSSLPFAVVTDPRVLCPAVPFFLLGWVVAAGRQRSTGIALGVLLVLNAGGTLANYRLSDTGAMTAAVAPDYTLCGAVEMRIPMERWRCERSALAADIVHWVDGALR